MTAINIDLMSLIEVLTTLSQDGTTLIDINMVKDKTQENMNKLIIYKVESGERSSRKVDGVDDSISGGNKEDEISNPVINTNSNEIFGIFNDLM